MESKRADVVRKLKEWIQIPARFPGGQLPSERELAKEMGVSRTLLREAVITLEALGILEVRERQGTFVKDPQGGDFTASLRTLSLWPGDLLIHIMEMRLVVEVPSAGLAALRRTEDELERMRKCVLQLEEAHTDPGGGASSGATWDSLLHNLVVGAAHNPVLTRVYEGLSTTMEKHIVTSRSLLLSLSGMSGKILEEHENLVEAIGRKDPERAMSSLRRHLEEALGQLVELRASDLQ